MLTLTAQTRGTTKSSKTTARRAGFVPAVVYGKDVTPTAIMVSGDELREVLKNGGRNQMIQISGAAFGDPCPVIIKEMAFDPALHQVIHVDFFKPAAGRNIRVMVPVRITGEDALTKRGIIMEHQLREVECECPPDKVPAFINVDVSRCDPGEHVCVGELKVPEGVRIHTDHQGVIVAIEAPQITMIPDTGVINVSSEV